MPRFLFYIPPVVHPTGGVGVLVEWVRLLKEAGFDAEMVTSQRGYVYAFSDPPAHFVYCDDMRRAFMAERSSWRHWREFPQHFASAFRAGDVTVSTDDVIVVPEYAAGWLGRGFRNNRRILLVQAYVWFIESHMRRTWNLEDFTLAIATSVLCVDTAEMSGITDVRQAPTAIDTDLFKPAAKRDLIAYMPRKRPGEVQAVIEALRARDRLGDYDFVCIDDILINDVARILGEARIFLSFSEKEGFGLPPAEAMASGCHVVGFTGTGGEEFFDQDWSYPVPDGHVPCFVRTVETVAAACRDDPVTMDARAARAAHEMAARYDRGSRDRKVADLFREIEADWEARMTPA